MMTKIITIVMACLLLAFVIELIRKEKLTFKYAVGWILVSVSAILLTSFDSVIYAIARFFGFELASNFIFFTLLSIFVFLSFFMTVLLCQQNSHNDTMAQKIGLLEFEVKQLKKKKSQKD